MGLNRNALNSVNYLVDLLAIKAGMKVDLGTSWALKLDFGEDTSHWSRVICCSLMRTSRVLRELERERRKGLGSVDFLPLITSYLLRGMFYFP